MKRISFALAASGLAFSAGCVDHSSRSSIAPPTSTSVLSSTSHAAPVAENPGEAVRQVHIAWENRVLTTPDVVNGGRPLPGVAGRMYLFGEDVGYPLKQSGTLTVEMHDIKANGTLAKLADWTIDPGTFQRLGRKDTIGWGYTLFLPWETYRPEIGRVQLQAKFVPDGGTPLFSPASKVTLGQDGPPTLTTRTVPAADARKSN